MITIVVWYVLFFAVGATFFRWIWEYLMLRKKLSHLPGPKSVPFLGMVLQVATVPREDRLLWFNDMCAKFKTGVILTWVGTKPVVVFNLPKYMEAILSSSSLITKSFAYEMFRSWIGDGLVTSAGETWFNHRRMITPAFHPNVLEEYAVALRKKTKILINCIESKINENPEAPINMIELASKYALDAVCETAMGVDINCQEQPFNEYVEALYTFDHLSNERRYRTWLSWDFIFYLTSMGRECSRAIKTMQKFSSEVIERKQRERKNESVGDIDGAEVDEFGVRKPKAFLDRLLDANENSSQPLSIKEVREEVDTFMAAGHDTTGTAICWALFAIGNEPDVQDKIQAEIKEVFGDETAMASTKQLAQLKYLDRVIKEVLRLYPSIPSIGRCTDKDTDLGEYRIPKNTTLHLNIFQLHRNPEVWENPDEFDPDRFLPENFQLKNRYAYIPFSSGPRICIGQKFGLLEMKIVLTEVFRRWRISSVLKPSEMKMLATFILRPHNKKIQLYFKPIDRN